jgi:uncharacterized protein (TIGR03663 family)
VNRWQLLFGVTILAVGAGALGLRLPGLDRRPLHPDEANQAYKAGQLLFEEGRYAYDPHDHHGPSLYYLTLPALWLSGAENFAQTEAADYRIVAVLAGVAAVLLVGLLADGLGRPAAVASAVLAAISPALVFYSRYYIQESLLLCFTLALVACAWRYVRSRRTVWLVLAGAAVGLMHATKETWVIAAAAMAGSLAVVLLLERPGRAAKKTPGVVSAQHLSVASPAFLLGGRPSGPSGKRHRESFSGGYLRPWPLLAAAGVALAIVVVLYTSFFTRARGPLDSVLAYVYYAAERAPGAGLHDNPWHFYLHRLLWFHDGPGPVWTEGFIVALALVGGAAAITGRGAGTASRPLLRFLLLYTVAVTAAYSLIPYKTPWCVLTMLQGMVLLAGVGAAALWRRLRWAPARALLVPALAAGAVHLGALAWRANFDPRFYADPRNPYVYAHTATGVQRLVDLLGRLDALEGGGGRLRVNVLMPENYWPLPWYLRRFDARYAHSIPAAPDAPVVITTPDFAPQLEPRLKGPYEGRAHYGLRFGFPVRVYVARDLWSRFESSCAPKEGAPPAPARREEASPVQHRFAHRAMATDWAVIVSGGEAEYARRASAAAFERLDAIEADLSRFRPESDVSRINRLAVGEVVRVGPAAFECLAAACRAFDQTGGAFDPTVGPLVDLWRAGAPSPSDLAAARARVGMDLLAIAPDAQTVAVKREGVSLDLGGIGKGYALDRMGAVLMEWGVRAALLHGGRSTALALGPPPGRRGWRVEVRRPDTGAVLDAVVLRDRALSVSGRGEGGAARIFDPRTGRPVTGKSSAWAAAPSAALADALSTAFMVLSADEVRQYCARRPDVSAMLLSDTEGEGRVLRFGSWGN